MRKFRSYRDTLIERLKNSEKEREAYLKASLEEYENDGNLGAFLLALRTIAKAEGGMTALAEKTNFKRESLYRALSKQGNPRLSTLETILHALGFSLSVCSLKKAKKHDNKIYAVA